MGDSDGVGCNTCLETIPLHTNKNFFMIFTPCEKPNQEGKNKLPVKEWRLITPLQMRKISGSSAWNYLEIQDNSCTNTYNIHIHSPYSHIFYCCSYSLKIKLLLWHKTWSTLSFWAFCLPVTTYPSMCYNLPQ